MASNSARISFTRDELEKLRDLQNVAWGKDNKAYKKLDRAIQKIDLEKKKEREDK